MACAKRTNAARSKRPRRKSTLSKKDLSKRYIDAYDENAPVDDDEAPFSGERQRVARAFRQRSLAGHLALLDAVRERASLPHSCST